MNKSVIVLVSAVLAACGRGEHEDIKAWMKASTRDLKGNVAPLPQVKPFPTVAYEAAMLASPFEARRLEPAKKAGGGGPQPDLNRRREPLEAFPLESLKMVGSIARGKTVIAIIQADRTVYHVKAGNYVGQNFGLVTEVGESGLKLKELVQDSGGDWVERVSSLQLQEK